MATTASLRIPAPRIGRGQRVLVRRLVRRAPCLTRQRRRLVRLGLAKVVRLVTIRVAPVAVAVVVVAADAAVAAAVGRALRRKTLLKVRFP